MLRMILQSKELSTSKITDYISVSKVVTISSIKGEDVWIDTEDFTIDDVNVAKEELEQVSEFIMGNVMELKEPTGLFFLKKDMTDGLGFEWKVSNEERTGFYEVKYRVGYLSIDNEEEELAVNNYGLVNLND